MLESEFGKVLAILCEAIKGKDEEQLMDKELFFILAFNGFT